METNLRGRESDQSAKSLDIPATILDLAGIPVPKRYQGMALTPLRAGKTPENWRTDFYCEHHGRPTVKDRSTRARAVASVQ
jgi:arylsulfatase A-like enzyme